MSERDVLRAELRSTLAELEQVCRRLRADGTTLLTEVEKERARLRAVREQAMAQHALDARAGRAGAARQELQRRLDARTTTWRAVVSGSDRHWSAVAVRGELVCDARAEIDELERREPETARRYRAGATLRQGDPVGEWRS